MFYILEIGLAHLAYEQEKAKRLKVRLKTMTPEEQTALLKMMKKQHKKEAKHRRKLEVAREGRSLNFWGNR